jgi:hypothetical protein
MSKAPRKFCLDQIRRLSFKEGESVNIYFLGNEKLTVTGRTQTMASRMRPASDLLVRPVILCARVKKDFAAPALATLHTSPPSTCVATGARW